MSVAEIYPQIKFGSDQLTNCILTNTLNILINYLLLWLTFIPYA